MESGDAPWSEDDYAFDRRRLTVEKKKERIDDPDYEQPQVHMHTAPQALHEPHLAVVSGTGHQSGSSKPDVCCLVKGCNADLSNSKAYYRRFRICEAHMKSLSLSIEGRSCRFCQQCGKFHLVEEFDGANRNCRKALMIRFYKRRNMPLTSLQSASGRADAQAAAAAAAAAAAPAPSQQELKLEPRKRGRPRAPRPDILEEDPAGTSGGSGAGSPPPGSGSGAARAAAAAGFDSALQAAYIAASRGYQGATGLGVTPATAIGPPGYSQGGVRMAGIEIDEMDDDYERPPPPARRRGAAAAAHLLAAAGGGAAHGRRAGADRTGAGGGGGGAGLLALEDVQSHLQARVQAQLEASQGVPGLGGGSGGPSDRGPPLGYPAEGRHGSGSLSRCSSSHSQEQDGAQPARGAGGRGGAVPQLNGGGAAVAGGVGGGDGTREAVDALAALGGALAPFMDLGVLSSAAGPGAQLDLAGLLGSLGASGLLQAVPPQPAAGGEGPSAQRLQLLRGPPAGPGPGAGGQLVEEGSQWRGTAADAEVVQPATSRPSHTSTRSSDGAAAAGAGGGGGGARRGAPKLGGFAGGGLPSPHRGGLHPGEYEDPQQTGDGHQHHQQHQQQLLLEQLLHSAVSSSGSAQQLLLQQHTQQQQLQQRRGGAGHGKPAVFGQPPSMAVIKREGVEVLPGPGPTNNAVATAAAAAAAAVQDQEDGDRGRWLSHRQAAAAAGTGGSCGIAASSSSAEARRLLGGGRWGASGVELDVSAGIGHGAGTADPGAAAGRAYDRDRNRDILGLDLDVGAGGGGAGARSGPGALQRSLTAAADARLGGGGGEGPGAAAASLPLDSIALLLDSARGHGGGPSGAGGPGAFGAGRGGGAAATATGSAQYLRLEHCGTMAVEPAAAAAPPSVLPRGELRGLGAVAGGASAGAGGATGGATDEEKRNAAVARLLSQLPVSQQLDFLQNMPHDQMVALLQMLPHMQQVELLLELQDERRTRVMQEQQQQQQQLMHQNHHQHHQNQQQAQQLVVLHGRGGAAAGGGGGVGNAGRATLALDLAHDPPSLSVAGAVPAAQRITLAPVALQRKSARPPLVPGPGSHHLGVPQHQQHHHVLHHQDAAGEAMGPLELVSLAGAGTRLQRMPDGSTQVVLELPVAATAPQHSQHHQQQPQHQQSAMPVLRLQQPTGLLGSGGAGLGAAAQLAAAAEAGGGGGASGASLSLPGSGSLLLNLADGSIRLPGSALLVRGGTKSGPLAQQGGKATAGAGAGAQLLGVDYGGGGGGGGGGGNGEDALERLSLKLHGVRPEQLAADVAQRMQTWLQAMDAVTLQGTLRSGCVNLVLDINLQTPALPPPPPGRRGADHSAAPAGAATAANNSGGRGITRAKVEDGGLAAAASPPNADDSDGGRALVACGAVGGPPIERHQAARLAAAALAAALGLDVLPDSGDAAAAVAAAGTAAAAMGVRAMVQVGCEVVYPPDVRQTAEPAVPVVRELAPLALVRGQPAVLHMVACGLLAHAHHNQQQHRPTARLHVRLNGCRLGAFVQPEEELLPLPGGPRPPSPAPLPTTPPPPPQQQEQLDATAGGAVGLGSRSDGDCGAAGRCSGSSGGGGDGPAAKGSFSGTEASCSSAFAAAPSPPLVAAGSQQQRHWQQQAQECHHTAACCDHDSAAAGALVFLDPPPQAGLAVVEWESGGGDGVLGSWWPLVVAPNAEVAAEVNGLAEPSPGPREDEDGDQPHQEGSAGGSWSEACRLHQLLTDLGLVLDALHNSGGGSSGSSSAEGESGSHGSGSFHGADSAGSSSNARDSTNDSHGLCFASAHAAVGDTGCDVSMAHRTTTGPRASASASHREAALRSSGAAADAGQRSGAALSVCAPASSAASPALLPDAARNESAGAASAVTAPAAAAAAALDAPILDCYVRRAKRLLPVCISRGMPHTTAELLRFLMAVARVPPSELTDPLVQQHQERQAKRPQRQHCGATTQDSWLDTLLAQSPSRLGDGMDSDGAAGMSGSLAGIATPFAAAPDGCGVAAVHFHAPDPAAVNGPAKVKGRRQRPGGSQGEAEAEDRLPTIAAASARVADTVEGGAAAQGEDLRLEMPARAESVGGWDWTCSTATNCTTTPSCGSLWEESEESLSSSSNIDDLSSSFCVAASYGLIGSDDGESDVAGDGGDAGGLLGTRRPSSGPGKALAMLPAWVLPAAV